jgi:hypothetical protein
VESSKGAPSEGGREVMIMGTRRDLDYPAGWKNYPTWAVYIWLSDDSRFEAAVRAARHRNIRSFRELAEGLAAEGLVHEPSLASDLLGWALDEVGDGFSPLYWKGAPSN